jgi:hypothetical protein
MTTKTLADVEADFLHEFCLSIRGSNAADMAQLQEAIARAAYFKAERRGFEPGHELPDWVEAEEEIKCMIQRAISHEEAYKAST